MKVFKITFRNDGIRTMRKETEELVKSRLDWEARLVGKTYKDLGVVNIEEVPS